LRVSSDLDGFFLSEPLDSEDGGFTRNPESNLFDDPEIRLTLLAEADLRSPKRATTISFVLEHSEVGLGIFRLGGELSKGPNFFSPPNRLVSYQLTHVSWNFRDQLTFFIINRFWKFFFCGLPLEVLQGGRA